MGFNPEQPERAKGSAGTEHSCGPSAAITASSAALFQPPPVGHSVWTPPAPLPGQDRVWPVCCWGAWLPGSGWGCHLPAWAMSHPRNRSKIRKPFFLLQGFAQPWFPAFSGSLRSLEDSRGWWVGCVAEEAWLGRFG